jgi:hypothetical protein
MNCNWKILRALLRLAGQDRRRGGFALSSGPLLNSCKTGVLNAREQQKRREPDVPYPGTSYQ